MDGGFDGGNTLINRGSDRDDVDFTVDSPDDCLSLEFSVLRTTFIALTYLSDMFWVNGDRGVFSYARCIDFDRWCNAKNQGCSMCSNTPAVFIAFTANPRFRLPNLVLEFS